MTVAATRRDAGSGSTTGPGPLIPAAVLVGVGATVVAWMRLPGVARDTLWAEDGRTFLSPAAGDAPWATLVTPYAGYLHTVPRLEALVVAHLVPVAGWAWAMTAINCVVAGIVAGLVFVASERVVPWLPARVLLAGLTVLTPLVSREVLGNAANIHSILWWGAFWMLLAVPRSRRWSVGLGVAVLLAALTEIQVLFLLPLVVIRVRDRRTWPVKAALLIGAATQSVVTVVAPRPASTGAPDSAPSIAFGWIVNAVLTSWAPRSGISALVATLGPAVALVLVIPAASLAVILLRGRRSQRATALLLLAGSATVWTVSILLDPQPYYQYADPAIAASGHIWLARYGVVPAMLLLGITVIAISVLAERRPGRGIAVVAALALAGVLILQAPTTDTRRSGGPEWSPQVPAAAATCRTGVPTVRMRETLGWVVVVPCGDLVGPVRRPASQSSPRRELPTQLRLPSQLRHLNRGGV